MILREAPEETLADLHKRMAKVTAKSVQVENEGIRFDLVKDKSIKLTDKITVPATDQGVKAFGQWLDVPTKFLERLEPDMKQYVLANLVTRVGGQVNVLYNPKLGVELVRDPHVKYLDPLRLVEIAERVIDPTAPVVENWHTGDEFRLDIIAPETFNRGLGGDRKRGDITQGGIRIGQNLKANQTNTAPWVSEYLYRLACTNGMERFTETLRVEARAASVDEVLQQFEIMAEKAFSNVEQTIEAFYDLRNQKVDNPERTILRMAAETGLPARTRGHLAEMAPVIGDEPTMFDVVNLITNQANDLTLRTGVRRNLERAGGQIVADHAERCAHCLSKLN